MTKVKLMPLSSACEILDSRRVPITASQRSAGEYPYYGANGIQDYVDDYIFDDDLVLLAEDGGNFGSKDKPIAYRVSGKCWVNNHAHVLKPKDGVDVDYLCYALMFYDVSVLINGATRQKLTQAAMRKMVIPDLPLMEQLKITAVLNNVAGLISLRKQQLSEIDLMVKSRFVEMFGEPVSNPMGWETIKLGDVGKVGSSKRVFTTEFVEDGIPFYRGTEVGALSRGEAIVPKYRIAEEHYQALIAETGKPLVGDLLLPSICFNGEVWVVDTDAPFYFKDGRVLWVHVNRKEINSDYLRFSLRDKLITDYDKIASGTTFAEMKIFSLRDIGLLNPPLSLQNRFADFVRQVDKSKFEIQQGLKQLELQYAALMQQYFG